MKYVEYNDSPAMILRDQSVRYAELLNNVSAYAALFEDETCEKVAIYSENRFEWVYAFYAGWKNHCIVVPIDFMAPGDEAAYILEDCKPEVLFCSQEKLPEAKKALEALSYTPQVFVFEDIQKTLRVEDTARPGDALERDNAETALIIYTSGTTGSPKGAMISFDNVLVNTEAVTRDVPIYTPDLRIMVLLPLHHIFPLLGTIVMPLFIGGTCVFTPSMASEDILETLQQHSVTMILAVPRFYNLIIKGIREKIHASLVAKSLFRLAEMVDSQAFSRLLFKTVHQRFGGHIRYIICGGAAIDEDVARDFKTLGFELLLGYGMTEAAPMIVFTRPGTLRLGSSGEPLPTNEVTIVDGEITAKGRNVMQGYYHRPQETAEMIKDGWLYTGDLGYIDEDGFVYVTGRKKHIIVLPNGKNINPEEIESKILKQFETVREVAVFMHDDILQAVIYPNFQKLHEKGVHAIETFFRWDVIDEYNRHVSPAKKISRFTILKEELPKTRLGKIRRFQLPELMKTTNEPAQHPPEPQYPEYQMIKQFLEEQTGKPIYADAHLEIDLGLDSLDKVSLLTFLQSTFGVEMQDAEMIKHPTVREIAEYSREKKSKMEEEGINWHNILHEEVDMKLPGSSPLHIPVAKTFKFLLKHYFRLSASGTEHLPRAPFMLVANHQSYLDGFLIGHFLDPKQLKHLYFYADQRHFRTPWKRAFAAKHNIILVDINRQLKLSLQKMAKVLRNGHFMILFPEGARTRDGHLQDFKKTFAILSCELNVPVVPVVIQGAYEAMPIGTAIPTFKQSISVDFLPPIEPGGMSYEALTEKVYRSIAAKADDSKITERKT